MSDERIKEIEKEIRREGPLDRRLWELGRWLQSRGHIPYMRPKEFVERILSCRPKGQAKEEATTNYREWLKLHDHEKALNAELEELRRRRDDEQAKD